MSNMDSGSFFDRVDLALQRKSLATTPAILWSAISFRSFIASCRIYLPSFYFHQSFSGTHSNKKAALIRLIRITFLFSLFFLNLWCMCVQYYLIILRMTYMIIVGNPLVRLYCSEEMNVLWFHFAWMTTACHRSSGLPRQLRLVRSCFSSVMINDKEIFNNGQYEPFIGSEKEYIGFSDQYHPWGDSCGPTHKQNHAFQWVRTDSIGYTS